MASSSAAVVVVVIVIVLLLLLAFFWCGCCGGASSSCAPKLSKSYVPFSAGGLGVDADDFTTLSDSEYIALGDGSSSAKATFSGAETTAASALDTYAAAFTRDGQVRKFTVHAYLAATADATVTVALYVSPKSAVSQPDFAPVQTVTFDVTTTPGYFYQQLTTSYNVKAGDRWVVAVTGSVTSTHLYVVSGGFEYAQCC